MSVDEEAFLNRAERTGIIEIVDMQYLDFVHSCINQFPVQTGSFETYMATAYLL